MSNIENFGDADISGNERTFTVEQVMEATESTPWVPELTVEEKIIAAKAVGLQEAERLKVALEEAVARRDAAQADINLLREAMVLWEPIENRLTNGPTQRTRTHQEEAVSAP